MIAVIDYGMGNLRSVQKGLESAGFSAIVTDQPDQIGQAKGLILPGVGAFAEAMSNLQKNGLDRLIRREIAQGKPFLGICLGYQLLFENSEEGTGAKGLGIFPGSVRRFSCDFKVPHMGWNQVQITRKIPLLKGILDSSYFYFNHSYYVDPDDREIICGLTNYENNFASIVSRGNIYGLQFHPEKSSRCGLKVLVNFGRLVASC